MAISYLEHGTRWAPGRQGRESEFRAARERAISLLSERRRFPGISWHGKSMRYAAYPGAEPNVRRSIPDCDLPEIGDQVGTILIVPDTGKGHPVSRDELLGRCEVPVQSLGAPYDVSILHCLRIPEAFHGSGFPADHAVKRRSTRQRPPARPSGLYWYLPFLRPFLCEADTSRSQRSVRNLYRPIHMRVNVP